MQHARQKDDGMHADNCTFAVLMHDDWDAAEQSSWRLRMHPSLWHACDSTGVSLVDSFDVLCDYNEHLTDNCFQMLKVIRAALYMCIDASTRAVSLNSQIIRIK